MHFARNPQKSKLHNYENEIYLFGQDIKKFPILKKAQQLELARDWRDNKNKKSLDLLINCNIKLVIKVANNFLAYNIPRSDLVQAGCEGLIRATQQFDPEKGFNFPTYAIHWIKAYMFKLIIDTGNNIKLYTTAPDRKLFWKLGSVGEILHASNDEKEELRQKLAKKTKLSMEQILKFEEKAAHREHSLDKAVNSNQLDSQSISYVDLLVDEKPLSDIQYEKKELMRIVLEAIRNPKTKLNTREKAIIYLRYLNEDEEIETLRSIGERYKISRERVRQIESSAIDKIRDYVQNSVNCVTL